MSVFSKIASSYVDAQRKLYNYQISLSGAEAHIVYLKVDVNKYKDSEVTVRSHGDEDIVIDLPTDLPITKLRKNLTDTIADTSSVYLFDILPVRIFTSFESKIEKGDLIIHKVGSDTNDYYLVLEVADTMGNIQAGNIIYKEHNSAPYTRALPVEVQNIINGYKATNSF